MKSFERRAPLAAIAEAEENPKSYMNAFGTTRMGRISIAVDAIKEDPQLVLNIMKYIIPIYSKYMTERESIYYLAICDDFDELDAKEDIVPEYLCQVHNSGKVTFKRLDYKRRVKESTKDEIMKTIVENNINMEDFKAWVRTTQNATDEDFEEYNEDFLQILKIYVARRD